MKKLLLKLNPAILSFLTIFLLLSCQDGGNETSLNVDPVVTGDTSDTGTDSDAGLKTGSGILTEEQGKTLVGELEKKNITGVTIDLNVKITVPKSENPHAEADTVLWGTLIRPASGGKLPTILIALPYRREMMMTLNAALVMSGYNVFAVDIRGTGSSTDKWVSFGLVEQYDIKYVVDDFIPAQAWSDGKVGMIGGSYLGIIQMMTAGLVDADSTGEPVHLKAIFPQVPMADVYRDIVMHGGSLDLLFIPAWLGAVDILSIMPPLAVFGENEVPTLESINEASVILSEHFKNISTTVGWIMDNDHMNDGYFYTSRSAMIYWPLKPEGGWGFPEGNRTLPSKLPVLTVGGWFDIFTRGTFNTYQHGLSRQDQSDKRMIVGPYYHIEGAGGIGLDSILSCQLPAKWFNWKIKGIDEPVMEEFPVMLYVLGEEKWRGEKSWPLSEGRAEKKTLYLTKKNPSAIEGDWYSDSDRDLYLNNNYGLSENADYDGENPVLKHNPLNLHGLNTRSTARWFMGIPAMVADLSKYFLNINIDASQWYEDERSDEKTCLTFTTEPLGEDLEITGPLTVTFWARTEFGSALEASSVNIAINTIKNTMNIDSNLLLDSMKKKDVQWVAELNDVFPDGRARNITSGWLTASHRQYDPTGKTTEYQTGPWYNRRTVVEHALDPAYVPFNPLYHGPDKHPVAIKEGELYQYTIELWPTCNIFKKGHRVRISISASDFPHLLPFLQSSDNTIVIDAEHEAKIEFTSANKNNEGVSWAWIGDDGDADRYLLNGDSISCGTSASASEYRGTTAGFISELLGLLFIMMVPFTFIACGRLIKRKLS